MGAWRTLRQLSPQPRPEVLKVWTRIVAVELEGRGQSHYIPFGGGAVGISDLLDVHSGRKVRINGLPLAA